MSEAYYVPLLISTGLNLITALFATKPTQKATAPNLRVPKSDYGSPLPRIYGKVRIEGNKFWPDTKDRMYRVETSTRTRGGKGFGGGTKVETKTVYGTLAVLFAQGHCDIDRIIVNGKQIDTSHNFYQTYCTWFDGRQTTPWSEIVAKDDSPYNGIAYKGINYIVFKDLPLEEYGNQIPQQISAVISDANFGTQPTLDLVVKDICERGGLDSSLFDVTELQSIILKDGLIVPESGGGYRKTLEDLMGFYLFTATETKEGIIKFKKFNREGFTPIVIEPQQYFPVSDGGIDNQLFTKTVEPKQILPNKITVKYNNNNQNWDSDEIVEYFEEFTKENSISIDIALTSYPYEVKERARLILRHLFLQQRNSYTFSLPGTYLNQLNLLDLVELPNSEIVQIHQLNLTADFKLEVTAKYYGGLISYSYVQSNPENSGTPPTLSDPTQNIPNIYILDIPQIEDYPPNTLYICATAPCTVQASIDGGINYQKSVYHQSVSSIANIISPLASSSGLDAVNSFDIEIESGGFDTITQQEFDSGSGLGLIARQVNGYWEGELIKLRDVQILSTTQRRISYIARNQFNTVYTATQTKFFLLKAPNAYYSIIQGSADLVGKPLVFRPVVASWQNLATTPSVGITPSGNAYKPPAPTNLTGTKDEDGNVQLFWDYNSAFSPYNNSQEQVSFDIQVLSGRLLTSPDKNVLYIIGDRTEDGVSLPITVTIWAVSSVVGRGYPYTDTVDPVLIPNSIFATGSGLRGIINIYGDYTVQESDNNKIIVGYTIPGGEFFVDFPDTLSNGFTAWVCNAWGNQYISYFTIRGSNPLTREEHNRIKVGDARQFIHISNGTYFVIGINRIVYDYFGWNVSGVIPINGFLEIETVGLTLTFPEDAIEGDFIGIKTASNLDFLNNPLILQASNFPIEGGSIFSITGANERYLFYFAGTQWIYLSRYIDNSSLLQQSLIAGTNIDLDYDNLANTTTINVTGLATVATSGSYNDLSDKPIIPNLTVKDGDGSFTQVGIVDFGSQFDVTYTGELNEVNVFLRDETIDDRISNLLVPGSNITLDYDDNANTLTINSTGSGGGSFNYELKTTNFTASSNTIYFVDTTSGQVDCTLPASPSNGDVVGVIDRVGSNYETPTGFGLNTCRVLANTGHTIQGYSSLSLAWENTSFFCRFYDGKWNYEAWNRNFSTSQFYEFIDDRVSNLLVAGSNVTLDYDDNANTLTINSSGGGGGSTDITDIWLYGG